MEEFGYITWTETKDTFVKAKEFVKRESESKSDFYIIPVLKIDNNDFLEKITKEFICNN